MCASNRLPDPAIIDGDNDPACSITHHLGLDGGSMFLDGWY